MSCSLPQEILDLIVDYLHKKLAALKACCVVAKSWIHRSRKHLFARVEFRLQKSHIELWKGAFPNPSNSPAHHTRNLSILGLPAVTAADMDAGGWIHTFCNVTHLRLRRLGRRYDQASLVPFHGLSSTVRSLHLSTTTIEDFNLVCSFPLLEDLAFYYSGPESDPDGWTAPLRSPKLTGFIDLGTNGVVRAVIRRLLDFPDCLHLANIKMLCLEKDFDSATKLVSRCSSTLKFLAIFDTLPATRISRGPLLDLSKATELKFLTLWWRGSNIRRIIAALQAIESKKLARITIYPVDLKKVIAKTVRQQWKDLDCLLVRFSTSHSIRIRVMYAPVIGRGYTEGRILRLLPKLTRRGLVDIRDVSSPLCDH